MSFLIESIARQAPRIPRTFAVHAPRAFSTSVLRHRTATEAVKDGLKSVDRAVSDKLVDGITVGEAVVEDVTHGKTAEKAAHLRGEAKSRASEFEGQARGAAEHAKGQAKGAAEHAKGKVKGVAEEIKSKM
ncbi:hypothetical protein BGZ63DRAFT_370337 [Mariannaea sp. PMI_226]|nr:hypothetical protein BGZ63DRAFT_370337 [Mariannaea sp. PMI_226]